MVDNFDIIIPMLDFSDSNYFYFVQILQRKKDHKAVKVNGSNNNSRLIKAYYIDSLEKLEFVKPEIIELCKLFNARAGIDLNRKNYEKMCFQHLKKITDQILNGEFKKAHRAYNSAVGSLSHEPNKKWILDLDGEIPYTTLMEMEDIINKSKPEGKNVIKYIPSKSGLHLITKAFDCTQFRYKFPDIEIHKNNPTNLYIP